MAAITGGNRLKEHLAKLKSSLSNGEELRLGFLEGATYPDGTPVPLVAAANEFGNPANNQPPRPFFRRMVDAKKAGWAVSMGEVLKHSDYDGQKALGLMGEGIKGQLQQSIRDFILPGLAPYTVERKGSEKPLIETGVMLSAVDYEVGASNE